MKILTLFLTCADTAEADSIAAALLRRRLIACAKQVQVSSSFLWQGAIQSASEVLLIMDTADTKFDQIELEVKKLHSYDNFVLVANEAAKVSGGVHDWITNSLEGR